MVHRMNMNHKSNSRQNRMAEIISCEQKLKKKKVLKTDPTQLVQIKLVQLSTT